MTPSAKPAAAAKKTAAKRRTEQAQRVEVKTAPARAKKADAAKAPSRAKRAAASDPVHAALDRAIADLQAGERTWRAITVDQRATLLKAVRTNVAAVAEEWANVAADSKGLHGGHPLRGEEWMSGPYAVLGALDAYVETLTRIAHGRNPSTVSASIGRPAGAPACMLSRSPATTSCCSPGSAARCGWSRASPRGRRGRRPVSRSARLRHPVA
ncbi:hypothetical protein [Microbacterium sp. NIBRBAC000506063]|uniref:hypothetical protein n=1 Tax=Microbacterium sp. NIBRBAC000506063 TaxID=2734618 RepID=UPI001CB719DD|nr:hypothetical protein [Microbacterium sp. NIBRBAC000506063]